MHFKISHLKLNEHWKTFSLVKGRIRESMRMSNSVSKRLVYVYIRYVYTDSKNLLTEVIHHKNI